MRDSDVAAELRRSFAAALDCDDPVKARAALVEAGWLDALDADPALAVALVFGEQGRLGRDAAALDDVVAGPLGTGEVAVAYPAVPGRHVVLPAHRHATRLLWIPDLSGEGLVVVGLDEPLHGEPVNGIDPGSGLLALADPPAGSVTEVGTSAWPAALAAGRVALAHQLVAGARELLRLATAYAKDRRQFGVPIGSFQAVKHRLAETLVAISGAEAAVAAASVTATATGATIAKALAGRAAETAGRHCLQVFGGIGFTSEHDFHRSYRRSLVLDRLLGDRRALQRQLGQQLRCRTIADAQVVDLHNELRLEIF